MTIDPSDLLERFLRYVQIETRSDAHSPSTPSTPGQWDLLRLLSEELAALGAKDVVVTEFGYVLATIPATTPQAGVPRLAWCAHVDTATNLPSAAKPIVHRAYDGRPIVLPDNPAIRLTVESTKHLREAIGQDVITASGTSLLGADDKSGVAVVMAAARHLLQHPEIPHGTIRLCFNPDEEIARGMSKLDLAQLGADVGYTLDGEEAGEICFETFSADAAILEIEGVASHPGWAKDVMVNALRIAGRFLAALPRDQAPETTAGRDGFIHPTECSGTAEHATVRMILRDFELAGLAEKHALLERLVAELQAAEPRAKLTLSFVEQYRNMRYWLEKDMRPVEFAQEAIRRAGLQPHSGPIRGGTDGSNLTQRGLPTPNLFVGMHDVHSQREWVTLQDMTKAAETLVHLAQVWAEARGATR
ncbi:peptidase T [Opitutus sp. ER46]|uniref:peptidase T n=1 Tax=Opitutus sp. ER46 TaxID=2161864 RepID=UPI000D2FDC26|nr:peptidase T [Opitutus sp. ER46]PTY00152.1 peptidase T [Opitutus sp. ER46]